jgi:phage tail sheath gpL-like
MGQTLTVVLGASGGTPGTGTITIQGAARSTYLCGPDCHTCSRSCSTRVYNSGTVTVTVAGNSFTVSYLGTETAAELAASLAAQINLSPLVSATVSGATITLTSRFNGAQTNFALATSYTFDTANFTAPAFTAVASGPTLTGGSD